METRQLVMEQSGGQCVLSGVIGLNGAYSWFPRACVYVCARVCACVYIRTNALVCALAVENAVWTPQPCQDVGATWCVSVDCIGEASHCDCSQLKVHVC